MPEQNTENRFDARLQHSARIVLEDFEGGVMNEARMVNYSKKGLYFESDFYLVPGTEIFAGMNDSPFASESDVYECYRVRIKWRKFLEDSLFDYGYGIEIQSRVDRRKQAGKGAESRRHARKPCAIPTLIEDKKRRVRGEILDASQGGVFITCEEPVHVGQKVSVMIPLKKKQKLVVRVGEVVRSDAKGIAVKFHPHPPDKPKRS
jgi:hypothetical protein